MIKDQATELQSGLCCKALKNLRRQANTTGCTDKL
jgi:hypothetical protein